MKSQKSLRTALLFALCLITAGSCDKSGGDDLGGIYLPDFSNDWTVVKGTPTGIFSIASTVTDSAKGTGDLTAHEEEDNGITDSTFNLKGSFQNIQVTLGYLTNAENGADNGPRAGFTYKGIYDTTKSPHLLRLLNVNNSSDSLVLKKGS